MAKRPRSFRLRRPPGAYWIGQKKGPDPNLEPQRLTLYLPGVLLDLAEEQSGRTGESVQEYCERLLGRAIEDQRAQHQLAETESRRGAFEGLKEIASDPDYLAEWTASAANRGREAPPVVSIPADERGPASTPEVPRWHPSPDDETVLFHAGQAGDDPRAFLACLRRGEPVPAASIAELEAALDTLEARYRGAPGLDRRVAFALHRLAFESQILHTDAWPGAFDQMTIATIRTIQERVERVLSGQDIRYDAMGPDAERPT